MDFSVFDHLLEGVQVVSDDMRYIYLNDSIKEQGGISGKDVLGLKCEEVYPGIEESSAFVNIRECIRTGEPINFMNRFDFPDGSVGYFELRMSKIEGGVLVFSVDRTDEMRKEEQIRQANKRYDTITESIHSALFEWDADDKIVFGNAIFNELCTLTIGRKCTTLTDVLNIAGHDQVKEFKKSLRAAIKEQRSNFSFIIETKSTVPAAYFAYQLNVVICKEENGDSNHFIGYIVDVTEERKNFLLRDVRSRINDIFLIKRPLEDCLQEVLNLIVSYTPVFRVAEFWLPNYNTTTVRRRAVYSQQGNDQDLFLMAADGFNTLGKGVGLPGICMEQNEVIWWDELEKRVEFRRRELAKESRLATGIAIPIQGKNELVAVITLFSEFKVPKNSDVVNQLSSLCENIGHGILNKRISHQHDLLHDSTAILIFNLSPEGDVIRCSKKAEELFLNKNKKSSVNLIELIEQDERKGFKLMWNDLVTVKISQLFEVVKLKQRSGRNSFLKINAISSEDDDSIDLIALDISREKELLDLLYLSNKMASIGFWTIDLINSETILSGNARNLLGFTDSIEFHDPKFEFMKRLMPEIRYRELQEAIDRKEPLIDLKWDRLIETENHNFRLIVKTEYSAQHCTRISGVIQDITSIVRTEEQLEIARMNYLDLIDLTPIPIWLQDPQTFKIELVNKKACQIYGYSPQEFEKLKFRKLLQGEEQIKAIAENKELLDQGSEVYLGVFKHITKSGKQLFMDSFTQKIHFQDKDYLLFIAVDRTESLELQTEISRAVIQAQEIQKQEISRELHDNIGQLMVTSQLYLGLLMEQKEGKESDYLSQAFKLLEKASIETRQLSHNLNSSKYNNKSFTESIDEIIESLKLDDRIRVSTHVSEDLFDEINDSELKLNLVRLIQEALTNSIKHSEASQVKIDAKRCKDALELSITDNGKGFDTSEFKPGIGIYNMQSRVQIYHGELEVISNLGKGTRIRINIPMN